SIGSGGWSERLRGLAPGSRVVVVSRSAEADGRLAIELINRVSGPQSGLSGLIQRDPKTGENVPWSPPSDDVPVFIGYLDKHDQTQKPPNFDYKSTTQSAEQLVSKYGVGIVPGDATSLTAVQLQRLSEVAAGQLNSAVGRTDGSDVEALLESPDFD